MRDDILTFVELASRTFPMSEPIVDIGSLQTPGQEGYADLRRFFAGKQYVGCDIVSGPGVDRIEDVRQLTFADDSAGTVIMVETLEHVTHPARAVREVHRVLRPGGVAIFSAPFAFPIHHQPDYNRFTPEGMSLLLADFSASTVFFQGDAQSPHTVYGVGLKGGTEEEQIAFEGKSQRLATDWYLGGFHDPLLRFAPVESVLRCDRPERVLALRAGDRIEQRLVCERDGLARVDVKLRGDGGAAAGWLRLRVQNEDGRELRRVDVHAAYVTGERWLAFQFPAVDGSAKTPYVLALEAVDAGKEMVAFASAESAAAAGGLGLNGEPQPGTLCCEVFCARSPETAAAPAPEEPIEAGKERRAAAPIALAAARLQSAELHHVATALREAMEQLRADLVAKLEHLAEDVVRVELRQQSQSEQLVGMEVRQQSQSDQLVSMEVRQESQSDQLVSMEMRQQSQSEQLVGMELRQQSQSEQLVSMEVRQESQSEQLVRLEMNLEAQRRSLNGVADELRQVASRVRDVADFVSALRSNPVVRLITRLFGVRPQGR
jgi:SAM-dependent methyltransferase